MSDSKASVSAPESSLLSNGKNGGNVDLAAEARFSNFAMNLIRLDSKALSFSAALRLFNETKHLLKTYSLAIGSVTPHEAERRWFAFVVYSSQRLGLKGKEDEEGIERGSKDDVVLLSEILRASGLTLLGFYKELPQFMVRAGSVLRNIYGPDWEKRLKKHDSMSSPMKTITTSSLSPQTAALTTEKWLRTVIYPLPYKPSPELEKIFVSCDKKDIISDVTRRAQILLQAIFPSTALGDRHDSGFLRRAGLMDKKWAEQRRLEALKLYYRVLEAMCRAEARTFPASNLTSLLTNERFHRCTMACSAELILATHKTFAMQFPEALERIGVTAFDLSKVIESFVRHEESLPRELRRHLNSLEERILESLVWEKGSSMYNSLIVAKPALSAAIDRLGLLAEPMPSLDSIALDINFCASNDTSSVGDGDTRSPKRMRADYRSVLVERNSFTSPKPKPPPLQSAFATPTRPNPGGGGETCAETGINVFFSKITKLAAVRINGMVERLQLSQQIREKVYLLFQLILGQRTALFFNRHIDQIILASLFGVVTISRLSLKFSEIIDNYMKQPHCKSQVCHRVFAGSITGAIGRSTQEHVHIFTFYNKVFIPAVKPLLAELGLSTMTNKAHKENTNNDAQCPGSPEVSPFPSLPDMSPMKVSASQNVYVSPLRKTKMDALISHSSKSYYACVGESTYPYESPSKDLSAINNRLNNHSHGNRRGNINFNNANVEFVSDAMVANSLYLQNCSTVKTEQRDS